ITELKGWDRTKFHFDQLFKLYFAPITDGDIVQLSAVRAKESFNRQRVLLNSGTYIHPRLNGIYYAKPLYDWETTDVWLYIKQNELRYSGLYDKMQKLGRSLHKQRLGPWGNVAASRETYQWAEFYPDMWERAIRRLPALRSMARYGQSRIYQKGTRKPDGLTWMEWCFVCVNALNEDDRAYWIKVIKQELRRWRDKHSTPFPETGQSGTTSWKKLVQMIAKNDRIQGESRDRL
ncbi:MAG: phosphoadenosine phosphosulfate reductase family protein, partial [Chloroflexota bacterium]